ncbi:MAG: AAA family ATPase [Candidatus Tectomicrobia bacterium]|nr:AAA family ATPase [Candidatus Tectomicrobia bacterium]
MARGRTTIKKQERQGHKEFSALLRQWRKEKLPEERLQTRFMAEQEARELLEERVGYLTEDDLKKFSRLVNTDLKNGATQRSRLVRVYTGQHLERLIAHLGTFNLWAKQLFTDPEERLHEPLSTLLKGDILPGLGKTAPTMILYLRNPDRYNIWTASMEKGLLRLLGGKRKGREHLHDYFAYNEEVNGLKEAFMLRSQEVDVILSQVARESGRRWTIKLGRRKGEEEQKAYDSREEVSEASERYGQGGYTLEMLTREVFYPESFIREVEALLLEKRQVIFYGPPGTGKTFFAEKFARYFTDIPQSPGQGSTRVIQFHPSYGYEEFIEGIRPIPSDGGLKYEIVPGVFKKFCDEARGKWGRYVLIIDEINRGNIPKIFGELMYLLEYRRAAIELQYSGRSFAVPENIFLIGTMNTADRSLALVDHALRRRFHFIQFLPQIDLLKKWLEAHQIDPSEGERLGKLNRRLQDEGIEEGFLIGHSHFMRDDLKRGGLRKVILYTIKPMLEEYFYLHPTKVDQIVREIFPEVLEGF